jgi:hypothetical protein
MNEQTVHQALTDQLKPTPEQERDLGRVLIVC